jgi:Domain of unknown function (DUF4253)
MRTDDVPAGLPPGRLVAPSHEFNPTWTGEPIYWASERPLPDAPEHWARLRAIHHRTGLWPLLMEYPDDALQPHDRIEIDAFDAETLLVQAWRAFVQLREAVIANPPSMLEVPEDVVIPEDPGPPFASWPGLAPPGPTGRAEVVARTVVAQRVVADMVTPQAHIGLVPAASSADIPALLGWQGSANRIDATRLSAVLRSWQERFGAQIVGFGHATLYLSVSAPPTTREHAEQVALEHFLTCPDNVYQVAWTFPGYVDRVLRADLWRFWWD